MLAKTKIQEATAFILLVGMMLAIVFVLSGGVWFLIQNGSQSLQTEVLYSDLSPMSVQQIWHNVISFTPLGIIVLGLLTLIATQLLRVALLAFFYAYSRDYLFFSISFFIFLILLYSLIWRG